VDTKPDAKPGSRRRHGQELKRQVLSECAAPGASVARVAMTHGLNANLVHKWRQQAKASGGGVVAAAFVPLAVGAPTVMNEPAPFVDLELQRGAISVRVRWPMAGASSCAAWLREILR
jgi:transposase